MSCTYKSELFVGVPIVVENIVGSEVMYDTLTGKPYNVELPSDEHTVKFIDTLSREELGIAEDKVSYIIDEYGDFEESSIADYKGLKVIRKYESGEKWVGTYLVEDYDGVYTEVNNVLEKIEELKEVIRQIFDINIDPKLYCGLYVGC